MHSGGRGDEEGGSRPEKPIVEYHHEALAELIEAGLYYEERQSGLGLRLLDAVEGAVRGLVKNPLLWSADEHGRRKAPVRRFPYLIVYKCLRRIFILALAHARRRPKYWESRDRQ